ncbi:MAG: methylamine utilization protein [Pseudomarimonas sp.]
MTTDRLSNAGICGPVARAGLSMFGTLLWVVGVWVPNCHAATLKVKVLDGPVAVENAVISLHSAGAKAAVRPQAAVMDQVNSEFSPRVMTVAVGSEVSFPNSDKTRHHVYSFSPAKRFELPLYSGSTLAPVTFDVAGTVTVGCNIHDWMIGYIVVLDTPYRAISDAAGEATLSLPAGVYQLRVWHERASGPESVKEQSIEIFETDNPVLTLTPTLTAAPPPRGDDRLRALQDKFRKAKRE